MIRKAYSGKGDSGYTADFSGKRLRKDDARIVVGGKIDQLQSAIDRARLGERGVALRVLEQAQVKLWQTAAEISCVDGSCLNAPVTAADLKSCERFTDSLGTPPRRFVRFDTQRAVDLNECRVRCRELETHLVRLRRASKLRREVYAYINRLSSLFFMMAYRRAKNRDA